MTTPVSSNALKWIVLGIAMEQAHCPLCLNFSCFGLPDTKLPLLKLVEPIPMRRMSSACVGCNVLGKQVSNPKELIDPEQDQFDPGTLIL